MSRTYLRTADAAKYLGIGQSTLERKRIDGTGPTFRRLGAKTAVYTTEDLDRWADEQVCESTKDWRE